MMQPAERFKRRTSSALGLSQGAWPGAWPIDNRVYSILESGERGATVIGVPAAPACVGTSRSEAYNGFTGGT
jgi:hypothetical protein